MRQPNQKIALTAVAILAGNCPGFCQQVVHDARGFECGFIYEKTKDGKSGEASCSNTGERVFSNASRTFSSRDLCDIKEVFSFEDIKLRIDFGSSNVVWEREEGLTPFAVSRMTEYYMRKENLGRQEAIRKATERPQAGPKQQTYHIFYVHKGDDFVSYDPVTELSPKVGDGGNREGGISWGCLTPPLLHRRSDMPCPTITSPS